MRNSIVIISSLVLTIILAFLVINKIYLKPYDVPEISKVPLKELDIDFSEEKSFIKSAEKVKVQKNKLISLDDKKQLPSLISHLEFLSEDDQITYLKQGLQLSPDNHVLLNKLRTAMLKQGLTDEFIDFVKQLETNNNLKLHIALAYVDLLQDPDLGTAALGQRSTQSILILNEILEENPNNLLARYARGVNNLYWPSGLQRTEKAIQDLAFCVAIAEKHTELKFPLFEDFYITYGDALIKEGKDKEGRAVWERGYKQFPSSKELGKRSKANNSQSLKIVEKSRGIDIFQRPDESITDLDILWTNKK
ncbi:hypothetical protein [Cytobacillus firmus]|uniref:hypothetical protein n=1 Tax=Cytobacillus firmus TaxID=1399 RepID=UPI0030021CA1